jgi:hypothetical protein
MMALPEPASVVTLCETWVVEKTPVLTPPLPRLPK